MAQVKLFKLGYNGIARQHNSTADELTMLTGQFGNLKLAGNSLTSEDTNGNINLDPNGTGLVQGNRACTLPAADGAADQVLTTNGAGAVSFQDANAAQKICTTYNSASGAADRDLVYIAGSDDVAPADASAEATFTSYPVEPPVECQPAMAIAEAAGNADSCMECHNFSAPQAVRMNVY